jgi:hypothetical protein
VNVRTLSITLTCITVAPALGAQVGHVPQRSPYIDLEYRQEATIFGGYYNAGTDQVGVAPRGGPMFGVRYDLRLGGPASLTSKLIYVSSQRDVIDPRRPQASRVVQPDAAWPVYIADVGISLNLTGQRSYRHVVPFVTTGLGIATDFKGGADVGAWRFGTPFALSLGGGVKWVPAGKLQVRADVTDQLYQIKYPNSYYVAASDGTAVLAPNAAKSDWTSNIGLSIGVSYLFFR